MNLPPESYTQLICKWQKELVAPREIMFMPWGGEVLHLPDGSMRYLKNHDPLVTDILAHDLRRIRENAAAGKGRRPFIDLSHDGLSEAAEVFDIWWAGRNGIRAAVVWAPPVAQAIVRGDYHSFSPAVRCDSQGVVGFDGSCVGGLIARGGRPQFKRMQAITPISRWDAAKASHARFCALLLELDGNDLTLNDNINELKDSRPDLVEGYSAVEGFRAERLAVETIRKQHRDREAVAQVRQQLERDSGQFIRLVDQRARGLSQGTVPPLVRASELIAAEFPHLAAAYRSLHANQ